MFIPSYHGHLLQPVCEASGGNRLGMIEPFFQKGLGIKVIIQYNNFLLDKFQAFDERGIS